MTAKDLRKLNTSRMQRRSLQRWPSLAVFLLLSIALCNAADSATITFSLDFPGPSPEHYSIAVQSDGRAHYESTGKISADSDARDNYQADFTLSDSARARIVELPAQAHYLSGKVDSG